MNQRVFACFAGVVLLSACEPKAPEHPNQPPTPKASALASTDNQSERPTLTSRLESGGRRTQYAAYFENSQLARIEERAEGSGPAGEYEYHGARLRKYSLPAGSGATTLLELDDQGRVERAIAAGHDLAPTEIDTIRTHAQLLRSHALAQQASKMHGQ